jgi:hypothetical protein
MSEPQIKENMPNASTNQSGGMTLPSAETLADVLALAVAVLGVLAAFAGLGAWYFSAKASAAKDAALERFKVESASTTAEANARAAEANTKAVEAAEGTAKARAEAAAAIERTKKLELEAEQQRERAAKAERDLLSVKSAIAPRGFSTAERAKLIAALRAAPVKGKVSINCVLGDGEGFAFANEVDKILKTGGWETTGVSQGAYGPGGNPIGFGVVVHSAASAPPHAATLQAAFKAAGLDLPGAIDANIPEGTVEILVGNKPR